MLPLFIWFRFTKEVFNNDENTFCLVLYIKLDIKLSLFTKHIAFIEPLKTTNKKIKKYQKLLLINNELKPPIAENLSLFTKKLEIINIPIISVIFIKKAFTIRKITLNLPASFSNFIVLR